MGKDDKLQRYFDGELDADERVAFERSMTDDDRERLASLAELRGLLVNTLERDIDVWSGIEDRVVAKKAVVRRWRARRWLGTSAGLLAAAAATFLLVVHPWHLSHPTDDCDVESLEVAGGEAMVLTMQDEPHPGENATIIWATEED